jgi:intracellular sulfur oxidation DsrE/DsrF family protein
MEHQRRGFLKQLSLFVGGIAAGPAALHASVTVAEPEERWLANLHGKHKQFFDVGAHSNGQPMVRVASFMNAYNSAYGVPDAQLNVVFGAHGTGLPLVLNDIMWRKYGLGAHYSVEDVTTKAPAVRNPWSGIGHASMAPESVHGLAQRGVRFIACRNTIARVSKALAAKTGESDAAVAEALTANVLPGVEVVPAMIVAVNRAQESGLSYAFLG